MNNELLIGSKEIYDKAVADFKPKAIVLMFSGGDDSLTAYHVAKELGVKFDFVIHGNTRTGIEETTLFARDKVEKMGDRYIEADAGDSYIDYVMRKGFFGKGISAHEFSYHVLKIGHFRKAVSKYLRQRQRNFPILFINGARRLESENRKKTMINPIKLDPSQNNNIWVNIINEWDKPDCNDYLAGNSICRNAVSVALCRSGECMCGTMQSKGDRVEASYFYPKWGKWIDELDKAAIEKHGFGWGDNKARPSKYTQSDMFQPMCVGCTKNEIIE
jgi:3'-phosphoadenosine 5'-phosphosulfate sulfotransferase (PAPS reductase)/FAD synthetase